jgi:hypothetical protein
MFYQTLQTFSGLKSLQTSRYFLLISVLSFFIPQAVFSQVPPSSVVARFVGRIENTSFRVPGTVLIEFSAFPSKRKSGPIAGFLNFSERPGKRTLCGAGNFTGTKTVNSIVLKFSSVDTDPGCGFERGLVFEVTGSITNKNRLNGSYSISNGQAGVISAKKRKLRKTS